MNARRLLLDATNAAALLAVAIVISVCIWATTRPDVVTHTRYRDRPPITKTTSRAEALEHFHLGSFTRAGRIAGGLCYEYERADYEIAFCFQDERSTAPPPGHPLQ